MNWIEFRDEMDWLAKGWTLKRFTKPELFAELRKLVDRFEGES
jgi:hypothetical protein